MGDLHVAQIKRRLKDTTYPHIDVSDLSKHGVDFVEQARINRRCPRTCASVPQAAVHKLEVLAATSSGTPMLVLSPSLYSRRIEVA